MFGKRTEAGQGLVEYALILVLVILLVVVILMLLAEPITNLAQNILCEGMKLALEMCQ